MKFRSWVLPAWLIVFGILWLIVVVLPPNNFYNPTFGDRIEKGLIGFLHLFAVALHFNRKRRQKPTTDEADRNT
jgi:hypothetical protein